MPIPFGMPNLLEIKSPDVSAALCQEMGLAFIELNMNLPEYQPDQMDVKRLKHIAEKYKIYYTFHLDENLNPCDFNKTISQAYTETVIRTIEAARQLSAPILNMHLSTGVYFTLPARRAFLFDVYEDVYLEKLKTFRDRCEEAIAGADIKICVENSGGYNRALFLRKGLDLLLKSQAFSLTFDTGHNAAIHFADEALILERGTKLRHFHIHDVKEKNDHLPLGEGDLDLIKYIRMAEERGCRSVLEVKTMEGLLRSTEWLRKRGFMT